MLAAQIMQSAIDLSRYCLAFVRTAISLSHFVMKPIHRILNIPLLLTMLCFSAQACWAQFEGMKGRLPSDTNSLILINAEKILGSPVADRGRWEARVKAAHDAGISGLPPDASELVLAGRIDLEFGQSVWELALAKLRAERDVSSVAQRFGGTMDEIDGRSAVRLPNDLYVVQIHSKMLGSYAPANRQDVSRWLTSTDVSSLEPRLSPYLNQAFAYATKVGTPIVVGMDLSGLISAADVKQRGNTFEALKDAPVEINQLAKLISGVQGITLGITTGNQVIGAVRVDFSESPASLSEVAKPLLIEVLQRQGAMIEEIHDWTPSIEGNTFMLKGQLTSNGVRRVMSVLELPLVLSEAMQQAASTGADSQESATRAASQRYYQSITALLDDLREKPKRDHVQTFGQAAIWYDKYAKDRPVSNFECQTKRCSISVLRRRQRCARRK